MEIDGVDYGPLRALIGKWIGERGVDVAPDSDGEQDRTEFIDEIEFVPSGPAENAEEQELVSLRYRHVVRKKENGKIFHDQIGHWIYEPETGLIMHSLTIPRAVVLLAGGKLTENALRLGRRGQGNCWRQQLRYRSITLYEREGENQSL